MARGVCEDYASTGSTGGECYLPPQHEAQRRRGQRQGCESEEGDGRAPGRVREQP